MDKPVAAPRYCGDLKPADKASAQRKFDQVHGQSFFVHSHDVMHNIREDK